MTKNIVTPFFIPNLPSESKWMDIRSQILESGYLTNGGPQLKQFQKLLYEKLDYNVEIGSSIYANATLALIALLKCLFPNGGEVITTPFSFVATSNSILLAGLKPVFVDISEHSPNIDPTKVESAITPDTVAILAVHAFGIPADVLSLKKICETHSLKLLFDAAHAAGVRYHDESILNWGDASVLSFHATKTLSSVEGGAIFSKCHALINELEAFKNFGITPPSGNIKIAGFNAKMSEIHAAIGINSLLSFPEFRMKRKNIHSIYKNLLSSQDIDFIEPNESVSWNFAYCPVVFKSESINRDEIFDYLQNNGIVTRKYFHPSISEFEAYRQFTGSFPNSNNLANNVLCLPLYHQLDPDDAKRLANLILERLRR